MSFEIAKKLKEKGFRYSCIANYSNGVLLYNDSQFRGSSVKECLKSFNTLNDIEDIYVGLKNCIDTPTIFQVLKWLREKKRIDVVVYPIDASTLYMGGEKYILSVYVEAKRDFKIHHDGVDKYVSYEKAALAGIEYVIDNLI